MKPLMLARLGLFLAVLGVRGFGVPVDDSVYLFSYFVRNGEDGLHLAVSEDGLKWVALHEGKSFLTPVVGENKLMRDPCLLCGPDGVYRMVWTTSWTGGTIGYASSTDLKTWSEQKALAVMAHEPATANCWAPEIIWDEPQKHYLIFWSSTVPGTFPVPDETERKDKTKPPRNHRLYSTTTKDFETFTPTAVHYQPGFNVIDETMVRQGAGWVMFVKNETEIPAAAKNIFMTHALSPDGPWDPPGAPISPAGVWVEGPTAIKIGDWWHVYFDKYRDHQYGVIRSRDLKSWEDISDQLVVPPGIRHGTVLRVPRAVVEALR
ncbi:MAG: glycoside hydrolase family 43 protein [bacterium]|nr:glycoside hydrolase family 43 protein [bacterium]MDI1336522.1 glycoside hydrolase family 43 protein [Lacunisphaera sp.]